MIHIMVVMPQVSKIRLREEIQERMFQVFYQSMADVKTKKQAENLLNDLLTPTERIMLAKRLSIAIMLLKEYDYATIRRVLNVSFGTISRVATWLKIGGKGYKKILEKLLRQRAWIDFLSLINKIFSATATPLQKQEYRKIEEFLEGKKLPI